MEAIQLRHIARQAIARGDATLAADCWRRVFQFGAVPGDCLEYSGLLFGLFRFAEAIMVLEQLRHHPAATTGQLLAAARELFSRKRHHEAVAFTARALELDPRNPDTAAMHAAMLERTGEVAPARSLLEDVLRDHPRHARSVRLLAHIERNAGETDAAIRRLRDHLAASPGEDDWRLRYELAPALEKAGDFSGAMDALLSAKAQLAPHSRRIHPAWRKMTDRQWQLASALDRGRIDRWSAKAARVTPPLRLCLMGGFPRSGTTLLEAILASHPDCLGTDESGILNSQFRDPIVMAAANAAAVLAELDEFDDDSLAAGRAEYLRCTTEYLGEPANGRLLLEKDPLLTADLPLPLRLFPDAKILMPLRDPRDVVISFFFTIVPLAPNSVAAADLGDACRYYAEVMRHWLHLRAILPAERWTESRYEDVIADPERQTRRLAGFLELDWSPAMLIHHAQAGSKAVSTPTYTDVTQPLYTRSLQRWRHYQSWLEPHLAILAPFLDAFGYD